MNIFYTHEDPVQAAIEHCDRHRNKMIVESCQLLSTAHHVLGSRNYILSRVCKPFNPGHPSNLWVVASAEHYEWLYVMTGKLIQLKRRRTGIVHAYEDEVYTTLKLLPRGISRCKFKPVYPAMYPEFKALVPKLGVIRCYQLYLNKKFREWRERNLSYKFVEGTPHWYEEVSC